MNKKTATLVVTYIYNLRLKIRLGGLIVNRDGILFLSLAKLWSVNCFAYNVSSGRQQNQDNSWEILS